MMLMLLDEHKDCNEHPVITGQADTAFYVPHSSAIMEGGYSSECATCTDTRGIKRAFDDLSIKHATLAGVLIVITVLVGAAMSLKYFDGEKR